MATRLLSPLIHIRVLVGERCNIGGTGERGTCKVYSDCPGIEEQAKGQVPITICGYIQLTTPVICCKSKSNTIS